MIPMFMGQAANAMGGGSGQKGGGQTQTALGPNQPQPGMGAPMGQPAPNVYQQAAGQYNAAVAGPNIGQFMNPYTSEVIGRTGMDMARQAQMAQNTLGADATRAGAFGGSRHGVAQGTMLGDYGRAFGDMAAQQRQQGFNTALSAAQAQQGIQSGLAGQGFGFGQSIGATQAQEGQRQQAMNQALIEAAKGQFGGFTGAPKDALSTYLASLGGANMGQKTQTQTGTQQRGLFDYLATGAGILGGLCWVAREVYGEEDDRWVQFRTWLLNDAPKWLLNLYAKHGEWFAGAVRKAPILKRALRPLMDRARRAAGFVG